MNTVRKSLVVRATIDGKQKSMSVEKAKALGVAGTFYMKVIENGKIRWEPLGKDPSVARNGRGGYAGGDCESLKYQ
jgi:hypothetical protein